MLAPAFPLIPACQLSPARVALLLSAGRGTLSPAPPCGLWSLQPGAHLAIYAHSKLQLNLLYCGSPARCHPKVFPQSNHAARPFEAPKAICPCVDWHGRENHVAVSDSADLGPDAASSGSPGSRHCCQRAELRFCRLEGSCFPLGSEKHSGEPVWKSSLSVLRAN